MDIFNKRTVVLDLHGVCNQECPYCVAGSSPMNSFGAIAEESKLRDLLQFFAGAEPSNILCTGGEPLITPGFEDLCRAFISQGHDISLQTNLKKSPDSFMASVPPEKTDWILASLHSVALGDIERFLAHARLLKNNGYPIIVKLILDSHLLQNLQVLYDIFTSSGIGVVLAPLMEFPSGKSPYPMSYTPEEWKVIAPRVTLLSSWLYFDGGFRSMDACCAAGSKLLYISMLDGSIRGCSHGFPATLGNIYQNQFNPCPAPVDCGLPLCICDFHFYLGVIKDIDDSEQFGKLLNGTVSHVSLEDYQAWLRQAGIKSMEKLDIGSFVASCTQPLQPKDTDSLHENLANYHFTAEKQQVSTLSMLTVAGCAIDVGMVHVYDLHTALSFKTPLEYPKSSLVKKFSRWKMEIDDAPIFRYIYRNAQPRRHLEFGTWQGNGTIFCLEECAATVWTINRPFGEKGDYGFYPEELPNAHEWAKKIGIEFSENGYSSDSIGFIGKSYLERNLGYRVCQIYCDSREWDTSNMPEGFFDTVLVDGGHTKDIVINDTKKAMPLLRSGGVIMWHDFCPTEFQNFEACKGVMDGIAHEWEFINSETSTVFWIYPSMILVGIKK